MYSALSLMILLNLCKRISGYYVKTNESEFFMIFNPIEVLISYCRQDQPTVVMPVYSIDILLQTVVIPVYSIADLTTDSSDASIFYCWYYRQDQPTVVIPVYSIADTTDSSDASIFYWYLTTDRTNQQ
jgi:hypothetical protein